MIDTIISRLFQASTIKGIIQLGGSLGLWSLNPSAEAAVIAAVMGVLGLINVIWDEKKAAKQAAAKVAVATAANVADQVAEEKAVDQSARIAELEAQIVELQRKLPLPWLPESQTPIKG